MFGDLASQDIWKTKLLRVEYFCRVFTKLRFIGFFYSHAWKFVGRKLKYCVVFRADSGTLEHRKCHFTTFCTARLNDGNKQQQRLTTEMSQSPQTISTRTARGVTKRKWRVRDVWTRVNSQRTWTVQKWRVIEWSSRLITPLICYVSVLGDRLSWRSVLFDTFA